MKTTFSILLAIIILVVFAVRYHYMERKNGIPAGTVKICSPSNTDHCHFVDEKIVNAVYENAASIAKNNDAELFPLDTTTIDNEYMFDASELDTIAQSMAKEFGIALNGWHPQTHSLHELILFLHQQVQAN